MKTYIGNCTNSFDHETGECFFSMFVDVSDFACIEEESTGITRNSFLKAVECNTDNYGDAGDLLFLYNEAEDVHMIYNEAEDIHYFFD